MSRLSRVASILAALILSVGILPAARADASPWYLGASVGSSSYGGKLLGGSSATANGHDLIGGYRLSRHWALEASYFDMGSADSSNRLFIGADFKTQVQNSVELDGYALSMVGTLPFGDTWSGFVTVGAAESRTKVATTAITTSPIGGTNSISMSVSASKQVFDYGAGVQADTGGAWVFRLGWRTFSGVGKTDTTGSDDVSFLFVSALWSF